jgi:NADPH:quinone reductase-like Zn-dependent oxidoreductase
MRAVAMTGFDTAPTLTDLDVPEPAEGEVRVRIHAASVNGFDLAVAAGYTKDYMEHRFPLVLGKDFSGEVDALGAGVTDYAVGDRVFGTVTKPYLGDGSFAEYVTVPTAVGLAPLPETVSFTDAAALGLAGAAAHGIIDAAALQPGQTLLVAGATGGVGTQVLQLAAAAGARVIATAHTDPERELVTRLGADVVVDHQADLAAQVRAAAPGGVDAIAHLAGDVSVVELVREGGRFASTLVQSPEQVPTQTATVFPVFANPTREVLDQCAQSLASGDTTVTVQQVFPLEQLQAAFNTFGQGTLGKVVITTD